ncbi:Homeobox domain-containing protein/HALZ domain-containing protein [Cephalotus follicularis]|uniref:Homeobox domain-containing protein/HALZ domain-containing protein n=1 Tax=Cephalotus follicularis TaxID=3775 RepID=A0A1Q3CBL0_CEPFO|nr:Homeobox domain-containing protein/HALZ domain-containing protein [Cephalotus follicularis]
MELGLSLGDASKPFGIMDKSREVVTTTKGVGFCMALSIGSNLIDHQQTTEVKKTKPSSDEDRHQISALNDPPIQLNLLPNTPVLWPSSDNGSSEGGSSGQMGRGFDVNRFPNSVEDTQEAVSSSPPNSAASSFHQMDFCMYTSTGSLGRHMRDLVADGGVGNNEVVDAERTSSRASDDDENGSSRKKLRLSKEQSAFLEESFKEHSTLNPKQKLALAKQLNLRPRQVEVWFQNRRARTKLKQTEVDCDHLKRCCETLTEENRRLHKELQELRALKASNPFYMQLPATTLTMCPSCERVATTTTTTTTTISNTDSTDPTSKANGFSLTRPRFYPFSQAQNHTQASTTSRDHVVKHVEK